MQPTAQVPVRINSPRVFGVRPGSPFLYTIAATGPHPRTFSADRLPDGLLLDGATGRITGALARPGTHRVTLRVDTANGHAESPLRIEAGEHICLTPPMGWNSWNCWADSVDEQKVLQSARAMVSSGLADHGWTYINIDDTWQGERLPGQALQSNAKFPDMQRLCAEIHALGLKAGIYSTPWTTSYASFRGGTGDHEDARWSKPLKWGDGHHTGPVKYEDVDARQWAAWGFDYLKYDWFPNDVLHVERMSRALRTCGRDMVYSLSNTAVFENAADYQRLANCWRTTGDIVDEWSLGSPRSDGFKGIMDLMAHHERWHAFNGPGHWNDPDMLVVGRVGWGPSLHPTHLTPAEQRTHISLWCLWSAPLLIGCPLDGLDPFTLSLLTNDEVLALNQDPSGEQAKCVWRGPKDICPTWLKHLEDGSKAVGFVNPTNREATITAKLENLRLEGAWRVRDLWSQADAGEWDGAYTFNVGAHDTHLVRLTPAGA